MFFSRARLSYGHHKSRSEDQCPLCLDTIGQAQSDPVLITVFRETFRGEVKLEELIIPLLFVIDVQIYGQVRVRQFLEPELYGLFRFHLIFFLAMILLNLSDYVYLLLG